MHKLSNPSRAGYYTIRACLILFSIFWTVSLCQSQDSTHPLSLKLTAYNDGNKVLEITNLDSETVSLNLVELNGSQGCIFVPVNYEGESYGLELKGSLPSQENETLEIGPNESFPIEFEKSSCKTIDEVTLKLGSRLLKWMPEAKLLGSSSSVADRKTFDQFSVSKLYRGKTSYPQFGGRDRAFKDYRTRLRDGLKAGPNFSGEFSVIQFGCGAGCTFVYVANNRTGQVYKFPRGGDDNLYLQLKYEATSRLLVAQWANYDAQTCMLEYFEWTGADAKLLDSKAIGKVEVCDDVLDDINKEAVLPISDLWAVSPFACDMISNNGRSTAEETVEIAIDPRNIWLQEGNCAIQKVEKISENTYSISASCGQEGDQEDRKYAVTFRDNEVILDLGYEVFSLKTPCKR